MTHATPAGGTGGHDPEEHVPLSHAEDGDAEHDGAEHDEQRVEPLGPVDVEAWGAGILGVAIGLIMALCFAAATSALGA